MAGYVACKGEIIKAHRILVWKQPNEDISWKIRWIWDDDIANTVVNCFKLG
jgi:hypothetical protein